MVTFGTKDLPWVVQYIRNQKQHHASGQVHDRLERIEQAEGVRPEGPSEPQGR